MPDEKVGYVLMNRQIFWIWAFCLCLCLPLHARQGALSGEAVLSLLTVSPSDEEVYTIYGHTALRVQDPRQRLDVVFNYGIFDFSKPNFIYRFAKGETDYRLAVQATRDFLIEYELRDSRVEEQVLALDSVSRERIWQALLVNNRPENRVYRYNFFFDNCATRPAALIEKQADGQIAYARPSRQADCSFRDLINTCSRNKPWLTFGCDLALGSPTDRPMTPHERLFLPLCLRDAFASATITGPDNVPRKLVRTTRVLVEGTEETPPPPGCFTPWHCALLFFLLFLLLTVWEGYRKRDGRWVDCLLFGVAGAAGCVLFFLAFFSTHPCVSPNWNLVWLHPLHGAAAILFGVKRGNKAAYCYHFINFAALTAMLAGWMWVPQHLNSAFIPLILTLWMRSGYGVYRKIWIRK